MERELTKEEEVVLTHAHMMGGVCDSGTAYVTLVNVAEIWKERDEYSILEKVISTLGSLVKLGLMEKVGPGKFQLTTEGYRIAESLGKTPSA